MVNLFPIPGSGRPRLVTPETRRRHRTSAAAGKILGFLVLMNLACGLHAQLEALPKPFSFAGTILAGGTRALFTLVPSEPTRGTIRELRWNKGKDPAKDAPDYDLTTTLYDIRAARDGTKVVCKASVPLKNPTVTFLINEPTPAQTSAVANTGPTVVEIVKGTALGLRDCTIVYEISRKDQLALLDYIRRAEFPALE